MHLVKWDVILGGVNCYESILENVGKYYNVNYLLRHLDSFGFECYGDIQNTEIESMKVWYDWEGQNSALEKLCGIQRHVVKANPEILSECQKQLYYEGCRPIGITTNAFYLPWTKEYKKHYKQHSFLLVGFDGKQFWGVDSIVTDKTIFLSPDVYYHNVENVMFFNYNPDIITASSPYGFIEFLKETSRKKSAHHKTQLMNFIWAIKINKSSYKKITMELIEDSTLIFCLANIVWSRQIFVESLKNIQKEKCCLKLESTIQKASDLYKMWSQVKYMFIKYLISSMGMSVDRICDFLLQILEDEEAVYASIENL